MIRVDFLTGPDSALCGFHVYGHSGYGEAGSDIVCAAVSSAVYLVANTITDVLHIPAHTQVMDGDLLLHVPSGDAKACRDIFEGLRLHLCDQLAVQYPQDINVSFLEV